MRLLRGLFLLLMLVALLPWGAWVNGPARFAAPALVAAQAGEALAPEARGERPAAVVAAERPCRKGTLPGSPCGPDLALLPAPVARLDRAAGAGWPSEAGPERAGRSRAPPVEPPRAA